MGKPFRKEIEKTLETIEWSTAQVVKELASDLLKNPDVPLFVVGSGGSLSACHLAVYLYQQLGVIAKAVTPYELYHSRGAIRGSKLLFISASGKNSDIRFAFKFAISNEPLRLISICMRTDTPLGQMSKEYSSTAKTYEFQLPSKKDGFLATNSLVGYFGLLLKTFSHNLNTREFKLDSIFEKQLKKFTSKIDNSYSYMVLYGGSSIAVAADIESKFVEAALGNVSICDYRNFAHGRHHWFAKRSKTSCIIALITEDDRHLANKTLSLLPKHIPILIIQSDLNGPVTSLDLLHKSFYLVDQIGQIQQIDPGRPGVPDYGSKLYNLKYSKTLNSNITRQDAVILRKANCKNVADLPKLEYDFWRKKYQTVISKLRSKTFGAIIFDYDGTLCSFENRFKDIDADIAKFLNDLLKAGLFIGIATGRGKSIRKNLQNVLEKKYWDRVSVGYYNGSDIGFLTDNNKPLTEPVTDFVLQRIKQTFDTIEFPIAFESELRPNQLTVHLQDSHNWHRIKPFIIQEVKRISNTGIEIVESTHSLDIVRKPQASKINMLDYCTRMLKHNNLSTDVLCFGDKGQWPGNDYELLATECSLSVNEVTSNPDVCWNFASPGKKNLDALREYFDWIQIGPKGIKISIP